jgi:hypothetical protein
MKLIKNFLQKLIFNQKIKIANEEAFRFGA